MQRDRVVVIFFKIFGYAFLGNLVGIIISLSVAAIIPFSFAHIIASVLAFILYHTMIFAVGYRGGDKERKLLVLKKTDGYSKKPWLITSSAVGLLMCIPAAILFVSITKNIDFVLQFRFLSGANFPMTMSLPPEQFTFAPFVYMIVHLLTPISCYTGFLVALSDKISPNFIIYKQKK